MSEPVDATTISAADVLMAVEDVKRAIRQDFAAGHLGERHPTSYSDLHDHVDANEYGGFTDPERRAHWPYLVVNLVQCAVDFWLREGGIQFGDIETLTGNPYGDSPQNRHLSG